MVVTIPLFLGVWILTGALIMGLYAIFDKDLGSEVDKISWVTSLVAMVLLVLVAPVAEPVYRLRRLYRFFRS